MPRALASARRLDWAPVLADAFPNLPVAFHPVLQGLMDVRHLDSLYARTGPLSQDGELADALLRELQVTVAWEDAELARVPRSGPVVVVANHPFGLLDAMVLRALLAHVRPDVKVMANRLLAGVPELRSQCLFVDPFSRPSSRLVNARALRHAVAWLRQGGMVALFPAGEVASFDPRRGLVVDPAWTETAAWLVRRTEAVAQPLWMGGHNSPVFHLLGLVHPLLRTLRLPAELTNKRGSRVQVRIGTSVPAATLNALGDEAAATSYLRGRTELLAESSHRRTSPLPWSWPRHVKPIRPAIPADRLAAEVDALPPDQLLDRHGDLAVYVAHPPQMPQLLAEIGRLREVTFRAVGEGTGHETDLDDFDPHYEHLFVWDTSDRQVVGAYRLARTEQRLAAAGRDALYTSTLFQYERDFFRHVGPAVELGRSFVRCEWQRQYGPLLLLWKGIGRYVARHPECAVLLGAVSISNEYLPASRELICRTLARHAGNAPLASLVRPRRPFLPRRLRQHEWDLLARLLRDTDELSTAVADAEPDGKGLPVLLRQYLKLGGQLVSFSLDPAFGQVLDGLVVVDLRQTEPRLLERYMGRDDARRFRARHGLADGQKLRQSATMGGNSPRGD